MIPSAEAQSETSLSIQPEPLVSVLMNCYNSDRFLAQTIKSVIEQTYPNWEIVFWDNRSTDRSAEIAQSFNDSRIRYFLAQTHTPLGAARALALAQARGEWVALLDCDDLWSKDKLERQLSLIQANPQLALVFCDADVIDGENRFLERGSDRYRMRRGVVWKELLTSRNFISCPAVMMKRSAVEEVRGFDPQLKYCEEYELFLRIAERWPVDFVPDSLVQYRIHQNNTMGFGKAEATIELIGAISRALRRGLKLSPSIKDSIQLSLSAGLRLGILRLRWLYQCALTKYHSN